MPREVEHTGDRRYPVIDGGRRWPSDHAVPELVAAVLLHARCEAGLPGVDT